MTRKPKTPKPATPKPVHGWGLLDPDDNCLLNYFNVNREEADKKPNGTEITVVPVTLSVRTRQITDKMRLDWMQRNPGGPKVSFDWYYERVIWWGVGHVSYFTLRAAIDSFIRSEK